MLTSIKILAIAILTLHWPVFFFGNKLVILLFLRKMFPASASCQRMFGKEDSWKFKKRKACCKYVAIEVILVFLEICRWEIEGWKEELWYRFRSFLKMCFVWTKYILNFEIMLLVVRQFEKEGTEDNMHINVNYKESINPCSTRFYCPDTIGTPCCTLRNC